MATASAPPPIASGVHAPGNLGASGRLGPSRVAPSGFGDGDDAAHSTGAEASAAAHISDRAAQYRQAVATLGGRVGRRAPHRACRDLGEHWMSAAVDPFRGKLPAKRPNVAPVVIPTRGNKGAEEGPQDLSKARMAARDR